MGLFISGLFISGLFISGLFIPGLFIPGLFISGLLISGLPANLASNYSQHYLQEEWFFKAARIISSYNSANTAEEEKINSSG